MSSDASDSIDSVKGAAKLALDATDVLDFGLRRLLFGAIKTVMKMGVEELGRPYPNATLTGRTRPAARAGTVERAEAK